MKVISVLLIVMIILVITPNSMGLDENPKIESGIIEELKTNPEVRIVIILKGEEVTGGSAKGMAGRERFNLMKEGIRNMQNKVLSMLSKENFKLLHRYSTISALAGFVTGEGINQLENNPDVERVYLDRRAYASLSESVPLIEADDVWGLGYTGQGQSVCVIDTGVDYTHADLGNPSCSISQSINGNIESYLLESPHPYTNNFNYTWTITKPGFDSIAVHFTNISTEANYDFVYLRNLEGNFVQVFSGSYNDIWSVSIPGDIIKIQLKTDSSITGWGFKIDKVLNGTINSTWSNCGQVLGGYDFVNNDADPLDDNGHGTHVSGIVASQNTIYKGVAPRAKIVAAKVLDNEGSGWFSTVAAGVDWCIDNKDKYDITTISMSLGDGGQYNNPETQCDPYETAIAINAAFQQGIFVSVASGNEGYTNGISYPACASNATSVGAVYDADVGSKTWRTTCKKYDGLGRCIQWNTCTDNPTSADKLVCFTNRDEILDLLAPGSLITSTIPGGFATYSGTSMAAPHVAGVASLMLDANNILTPSQIRDVMKNTGKLIYDSATGLYFSRVNASAAVKAVMPSEFISITLYGYPIGFGNLDPGTNDNSAAGNSGNPYKIRVDSETTVNVDLYQKGDDFASGGNILAIENMTWSNTNDAETSLSVNGTYDSNYPIAINVTPDTNTTLYYWLDTPTGQRAANYSATIYIKAVETGNLP